MPKWLRLSLPRVSTGHVSDNSREPCDLIARSALLDPANLAGSVGQGSEAARQSTGEPRLSAFFGNYLQLLSNQWQVT